VSLFQAGKEERRVRYVAALVVLVLIAVAVVAGIQWTRPLPGPSFHADVVTNVVLPGGSVRLPWPEVGQAAIGVDGLGMVGSSGGNSPQAIASIAKVMTAEIILTDHPLSVGESGPGISFSPADVAAYRADLAGDQSVIPVVAGESLSELQALEALLIPSANNIALRLAVWDAHSVGGFVQKMNASAAHLGLTSSHFTDPSGLQATTLSTPGDLVRLGEAAMSNPVFAEIVAMPQVTLPYAGTVYNYDYDLGRDGIVGIKTGSDAAAGGCFLFESVDKVANRQVIVVGAVLGQQTVSPITAALGEAETLVKAVLKELGNMQAVADGEVVGNLRTAWNASTAVDTASSLNVFGWPGEQFGIKLETDPEVPDHIAAGVQIGKLVLHGPGENESTPVEAIGALAGPSDSWRLER
jgi:serine-type D-Ala-D-Ala carboxypeptidase (penicillin-binding protein 5/6)